MTISKKVRDEAILICSIAACVPDWHDHDRHDNASYAAIAEAIPVRDIRRNVYGSPAYQLAITAWDAARIFDGVRYPWTQITDAEAVSLLETGWSPR